MSVVYLEGTIADEVVQEFWTSFRSLLSRVTRDHLDDVTIESLVA